MYWPLNKKKDINCEDFLEARGSSDRLSSLKEVKKKEEEETETEGEEEEESNPVNNKKRSYTKSNQPKKKLSISNIQALSITDATSSINIFQSDVELEEAKEDIHMAAVNFDHNECWQRIKQLAITSKHFTARDKNELIAQEHTFAALDDLIAFSATINNDAQKKARIDNLILNAKNQLKLYYFVGTEGWSTAIATIKATEAARIGLPEPKRVPKTNIVYVNPRPSYQSSSNQSSGYYKKNNYGRRPYKKE